MNAHNRHANHQAMGAKSGMNISLRHIEVFRAVMLTGSVTRAAAMLHTSQPTVSRELARLEHLLQLPLFERVHGKLQATAQAYALFEEVRRSYVGLERIVSLAGSMRQFGQGQLSIICLPTFAQTLLPGACRRFLQQAPGAGISITPQESPLLEEWLTSQRHDLGLCEGEGVPPGTSGTPLFEGSMCCVLPDGHPLLGKTRLSPEDFAGQDFISLSLLDQYRQRLDALFEERAITRRLVIETTSAASVCAMVRQGLGLALVNPLTALDEAGRGVQIRRFSVPLPFIVSLILPQHRPAQALVPPFIAALHAHVASLQAALADVA
jgi:DNA-binding transcriptional LysR family regulator